MDEEKIEELKSKTEIDNSRLEELLEKEMTPEMQMEIIETLKDSYLYLPIMLSESMFEGIEDLKVGDVRETTGNEGFDINYLTMADGNRGVPLFTSDKAMEAAGLKSSVIVMHTRDLVEMLKESDRYVAVAVNPLTEHEISMSFEAFINLFYEPTEEEKEFMESLNQILIGLMQHSYELEERMAFFLRNDENVLVENAVDGVFTPDIPISVSSNPEFQKDLKYTNILLFDKGKKVLPLPTAGSDEYDTVIAPETEFIIEKELDEFTTVWKCGAQPFYDDE